ncbi:unnamed protein product [Amoebophrya sp. A120]|nr:unnamed protein product [Amoebophrya sp. A120]|eukprot:GSA120T00013501001.1
MSAAAFQYNRDIASTPRWREHHPSHRYSTRYRPYAITTDDCGLLTAKDSCSTEGAPSLVQNFNDRAVLSGRGVDIAEEACGGGVGCGKIRDYIVLFLFIAHLRQPSMSKFIFGS